MIDKSTTERVLDIFLENPTKAFYLRELSRTLKLSMPTIISTTEKLAKEKLIIKTKGPVLTTVVAYRENKWFVHIKRIENINRFYRSGIVEDLTQSYGHPQAIILFGSFSRGEDIETSDIDIAVLTPKKKQISLEKYEKFLKRRINIHEIAAGKISKEFQANLYNGIILEGSW